MTITGGSTVTFGNSYIASTSGGTTGEAVSYEIIGGTGEASFTGDVLTVTKAGTIIYTAKMKGDSSYNDVISSAFTLNVEKAVTTISINNGKTVTYSKTQANYAPGDITKSGSASVVTFKYYSDSACINEISTPVNAGVYYAKASVQADDNYKGATSESAMITINPKPVSIIGVTVNDKIYDGKNTTTVCSSGIADGVISGDIVTVKPGICTFNSINTANGIAVSASGVGIEGVDNTMEYKAENGEWTTVAGNIIDNLAPGKYFVRIKATESVLESDYTEVIVTAGNPESPERTISSSSDVDTTSGNPETEDNNNIEDDTNDDANIEDNANIAIWIIILLSLGGILYQVLIKRKNAG